MAATNKPLPFKAKNKARTRIFTLPLPERILHYMLIKILLSKKEVQGEKEIEDFCLTMWMAYLMIGLSNSACSSQYV